MCQTFSCQGTRMFKATFFVYEKFASKKLYGDLQKLCGMNWKLPKYIKQHKSLLHTYDIIIVDDSRTEMIAPLFQTNLPLLITQ